MLSQDKNLTEQLAEISALFDTKAEWLAVETAKSFSLKRDEIEIFIKHNALFLEFLSSKGWQIRRVENFTTTGERLIFDCSHKFGKEKLQVVFVPRVSAKSLIEEVTVSRQQRAIELAELAKKFLPRSEIENVGLSRGARTGEVGKFAQILLSRRNGDLIAVFGAIAENITVEKLLTPAILWFDKLRERRKTFNYKELHLICEESKIEDLRRIHALLNPNLQKTLKIISRKIATAQSLPENSESSYLPETEILEEVEKIEFMDLWREEVKKIPRPKLNKLSKTAQKFIESLPNEIDVVRAKNGETLRFRGFPFARIRQVADEEKVWFGTDEKTRQVLNKNNLKDFEKLVADLEKNRCADAPSRKNFLAKSAPEAWLETLLRQDVSRLDPNLILAPLHAQLRLTAPPNSLDLLALRTDGRLVVIELKVSPDREFIFQSIDYWRQVELQRRNGNLTKSRLFGDLNILDEPPLVYLVAPMLAFHRDFEKLANCVNKEIEIWRYDLNETWREGVKVARRFKM